MNGADKKLLAVFDMDGVLVKSEKTYRTCCLEVLKEFGVSADYYDFVPFTGMGDDLYIGGVAEMYGVPFCQKMKEMAYEKYEEYSKTMLEVCPWSRAVLKKLHDSKTDICIASSAEPFKVGVNLKAIGVSKDIFKAIVTGLDVKLKKPFPDIFLTAAEKCGYNPSDCVVFEDALSGIAAAKTAGMTAVGVTTSFTRKELEEGNADFVCDDISEAVKKYFGI